MELNYTFRIPIGDWSGDGHGQCEWVDIKCSHPLLDVREAYFKAKKITQEVWPEYLCSEYEDNCVSQNDIKRLAEDGFVVELDCIEEDGTWCPWIQDFTDLVLWFIKKGNPDIECKIMCNPPTLTFFGYDDYHRRIGFFGYGLFG